MEELTFAQKIIMSLAEEKIDGNALFQDHLEDDDYTDYYDDSDYNDEA